MRIETRDVGLQRDVYATDRIGSVAGVYRLESGTASAVRRYTYLDLRRLEGTTWGDPMGGSLTEPFTHSGRYTDPSVGLQWDGNRWLDPKSKRFLSETPFGRASGTSNLYSYANNSWPNPPVDKKGVAEEPRDIFTRIAKGIDSLLKSIEEGARSVQDGVDSYSEYSHKRTENQFQRKFPGVAKPRKADLSGQARYAFLRAQSGAYDDLGAEVAGSVVGSIAAFTEGTAGLSRSWLSQDVDLERRAEAFILGNIEGSTPVSVMALKERAVFRLSAFVEEQNGRPVSDAELLRQEWLGDNPWIRVEQGLHAQADSLDPHYAELGRKSAPITEGLVTTVFSFGVGQIASRGGQALAWVGREAAAVGRTSKHAATALRYRAGSLFGRQGSVAPAAASPYAHLRPGWTKHIDSVVDDLVAGGRPKTVVLGEGGQGKIRSFVNREPNKMTEFLEMRPNSLDYSKEVKALKEAGKSTAAIDAETLDFNLLMIERLQQRGFTFKVIGVDSSAAAKSSWLKAELEVLERLGTKWEVIPPTRVDEVLKLPKWR